MEIPYVPHQDPLDESIRFYFEVLSLSSSIDKYRNLVTDPEERYAIEFGQLMFSLPVGSFQYLLLNILPPNISVEKLVQDTYEIIKSHGGSESYLAKLKEAGEELLRTRSNMYQKALLAQKEVSNFHVVETKQMPLALKVKTKGVMLSWINTSVLGSDDFGCTVKETKKSLLDSSCVVLHVIRDLMGGSGNNISELFLKYNSGTEKVFFSLEHGNKTYVSKEGYPVDFLEAGYGPLLSMYLKGDGNFSFDENFFFEPNNEGCPNLWLPELTVEKVEKVIAHTTLNFEKTSEKVVVKTISAQSTCSYFDTTNLENFPYFGGKERFLDMKAIDVYRGTPDIIAKMLTRLCYMLNPDTDKSDRRFQNEVVTMKELLERYTYSEILNLDQTGDARLKALYFFLEYNGVDLNEHLQGTIPKGVIIDWDKSKKEQLAGSGFDWAHWLTKGTVAELEKEWKSSGFQLQELKQILKFIDSKVVGTYLLSLESKGPNKRRRDNGFTSKSEFYFGKLKFFVHFPDPEKK